MEIFTLILTIWVAVAGGTHEIKRPGYSEAECRRLVAKASYPVVQASCVFDHRPKAPEPPPARSIVICPTWPPCWKDGRPINGHLYGVGDGGS
jgi:hypothetical protein